MMQRKHAGAFNILNEKSGLCIYSQGINANFIFFIVCFAVINKHQMENENVVFSIYLFEQNIIIVLNAGRVTFSYFK